MTRQQVIEAIENTFLDKYALMTCSEPIADDTDEFVKAIAAATAVSVLKAVELHSKVCRTRQRPT